MLPLLGDVRCQRSQPNPSTTGLVTLVSRFRYPTDDQFLIGFLFQPKYSFLHSVTFLIKPNTRIALKISYQLKLYLFHSKLVDSVVNRFWSTKIDMVCFLPERFGVWLTFWSVGALVRETYQINLCRSKPIYR